MNPKSKHPVNLWPCLSTLLLMTLCGTPLPAQDWPMWGGTIHRNMVSPMKGIPATWNIKTGQNIKWKADLGSASYGNPVVAGGKIFVVTRSVGDC